MTVHNHQHHGRIHTHGAVDPAFFAAQRGIWVIKWSFFGLLTTFLIQIVVVLFTGSVALLADTIHNLGDAATAVPLWVSFKLANRKPTKRFTYGLGRLEDLAGVVIVLTIFFSACYAGYESINRIFYPKTVQNLWAVMAGSIIGFLGNEAVAMLRIKVGREIESAALLADGYHARIDGLTSLAVLLGASGIWLGYPLADPLVGLLITFAIFRIVYQTGHTVFSRLVDGVDPEVIDEIKHAVKHAPEVRDIAEVRARWLGHRLHAEVNIAVDPELSVENGHEIAKEVRRYLLDHLNYLSNATIHVDPANASGEKHHLNN